MLLVTIKALVVSRSAQGDEAAHQQRHRAPAEGGAQHGHECAVRPEERERDPTTQKRREKQHDDHGRPSREEDTRRPTPGGSDLLVRSTNPSGSEGWTV